MEGYNIIKFTYKIWTGDKTIKEALRNGGHAKYATAMIQYSGGDTHINEVGWQSLTVLFLNSLSSRRDSPALLKTFLPSCSLFDWAVRRSA